MIDLAASSEDEEEQPAVAIDVEQLEELLLGPALALVKQELIGSENTLVGAASLPVVVLDRSHESMALSDGGARVTRTATDLLGPAGSYRWVGCR